MRRMLPLLLMALLLMTTIPCALSRAQGLRVDFYNVGKADAMLITAPSGFRMLIDAGTNKAGKTLAARLALEGIEHIDVMLITHFDKDHVGGADRILGALPVDRVILPVYDKESKQLEQLEEALAASPQTEVTRMETGSTLTIETGEADMTLSVTAAHKTFYGADEENDFSLCTRLSYGQTRFLFPGDAEDARQRELLEEGDVRCDVLKVPYHGRLVAASRDFLTSAAPAIAFIPDSDEEPAHEAVIAQLKLLGCDVYSARGGDLTVVSDGTQVSVLTP